MPFNIDLSNKTVLITGVSSGIGIGIASMFARANANIAGCSLEAKENIGVQNFIQEVFKHSGKQPFYVKTDVTNMEDLKEFVNASANHFGGIDIVASNAGTNIYKGAEDCSHEDWLYNMNLNLESHWNIARLSKPFLEKSPDGVIIINTSCHAFNTTAGSFPYNIAKSGLRALVQTLTVEWSPAIRTVGVAPGFIDTRLAEEWFNGFSDPQEARKNTEAAYPLKRLGTTDEIGGWFVFLASDYAAFAGGQTFLIDGGRSAIMMDS
ncbi:SDR family oxidoreductase [Inquilinus sp. KBS0705]|nr:SDR family oxidoreductase [Inquilinus sp. KBS0705]